MKRFGTEYGGFYYPENLDGLDESSIIYCIGAGEDISHDIEIAHKLNSNVYIIDPTPRAIEHYEYVKNVLEGKDKIIYDNKFGGNNPYIYWKIILENKIDTNKIIYKNYGVGINEGIQKFYLPSNETYVSCSLVEGMKSSKYIDVNVKKLKSIMNDLGHTKIDLLKMDIEGSECDVIENMLEEQIYPKYLAIKFNLENSNILKIINNNYKLLYQNNKYCTFKYNKSKILFLLRKPGGPKQAQYQHTLISIAEGLEKLNINFDSNINYYKKNNNKYLFNKTNIIDYNNYDYIITSFHIHYLEHLTYEKDDNILLHSESELFIKKNKKYKLIMIDWQDGFFEYNIYLKYYDFYFKSSYQNNILPKINTNIYPSVFNVTNRIINSTKNNNNWNTRNINLLYSHRISQEIREYMLKLYNNYNNLITIYNDNFIVPNKNDQSYIDWCQTGRRHNPHFYETLKKSKIVDCTGGFLRNINNELVICQIDSFKLWEVFFAGCCVIMIDLDLFNIKFPIQPQNMVHYIGITLNYEKDKQIINNIINKKINIEQIAKNGYEFICKYYTPEAFTKYILKTINFDISTFNNENNNLNNEMNFTQNDLKFFINNIYTNSYNNNEGGMGAPDLFSLWFILNKYKPKVVIESGVWNGISTQLIRKTLPDSKIICLDPRHIPPYGYKDNNINTQYFLGENFIDFSDLDISNYNSNDILCFFDCHQNAYLRVLQCIEKKINKVFLNDNYPVNCGSHYTLEHLKKNDTRLYSINNDDKEKLLNKIINYHIFPNIYPGKIKTGEGYFDCNSFFKEDNNIDYLDIFRIERNKYRWNTFILLDI